MTNLSFRRLAYRLSEKIAGRSISSKIDALRRHGAIVGEERARLQRESVIRSVQLASEQVPYYRELFSRIGFKPEKLSRSFEYFQDIPYLTKEIIQNNPSKFIADGAPEVLHERKTGGSTGLTLSVFYSQESLDWTAAVNLYVLELAGRQISDREMHLSSRNELKASPWKDRWRERVKCFAMNRSNVYVEDFSPDGLKKLLSDIEDIKPFLLQGHPSTLYQLALYLLESGKSGKGLFQIFESTGESIDTEKNKVIKSAFQCEVFNRFGNAEFGVVAHSSADINNLPILDKVVYGENFIYGGGIPEIVLTGLLNPVMPLIRYRTGDIGEIDGTFGHQVIKGVYGRIHDVMQVDGKRIPTQFLKDMLERLGGLNEFQVIQQIDGSYRVNVVASVESRKPVLAAKIKEVLGANTPVNFIGMSSLRHIGWRDKFRYLVHETN